MFLKDLFTQINLIESSRFSKLNVKKALLKNEICSQKNTGRTLGGLTRWTGRAIAIIVFSWKNKRVKDIRDFEFSLHPLCPVLRLGGETRANCAGGPTSKDCYQALPPTS